MFDRFEVCKAFAVYAALWGHDDETRRIEARLRASRFQWGQVSVAYALEGLGANGRATYTRLVQRHHRTISGYVPCMRCNEPTMGTLVLGPATQVPAGADMCSDCEEDETENGR